MLVSSNPFDATSLKDASPAVESGTGPKPQAIRPKASLDGLEWRVAEGLLATLFSLTYAYSCRGSARESEYFAREAQDLAETINAPAMLCRARTRRGEVNLHLGQLEEGYEDLVAAAETAKDSTGPHMAEIRKLNGEYSQLSSKEKDARQLFSEAGTMLEELNKAFAVWDDVEARYVISMTFFKVVCTIDCRDTRRASLQTQVSLQRKAVDDTLAPALLSAILCKHSTYRHELIFY